MNSIKYVSTQSIKESKHSVQYEKNIGLLRLVFTSDGVRVGVVVGVIRELLT